MNGIVLSDGSRDIWKISAFALAVMLLFVTVLPFPGAAQDDPSDSEAAQQESPDISPSPDISTTPDPNTKMVVATPPPSNKAQGAAAILPGGGFDTKKTNYTPYSQPGENEATSTFPCPPSEKDKARYLPGEQFVLSYANPGKQLVQSSDWWVSMGLQLSGWVGARGITRLPPFDCLPKTNQLANAAPFYTEPFQVQFVDFTDPGIFKDKTYPPPAGVSLWNMNDFQVAANTKAYDFNKNPPAFLGYNTNFDSVSFGVASPTNQNRVTVGLEGVHPLRADVFTKDGSEKAPWTNVLVESYSDWGAIASIHDETNSNKMTMTAANGSPFVWFERTVGKAPFELWVGGTTQGGEGQGDVNIISNNGAEMVLKVVTYFAGEYNPPGQLPSPATSFYAIKADKGKWQKVADFKVKENVQSAVYKNADATSVVVTALPHNTDGTPTQGQIGPMMAWKTLEPYACLKTVDTKLALPTPAQNVTVNGQTVKLGYDPANGTITGQLKITTQVLQGFSGQCPQIKPFQLVYPHHRKALVSAQDSQIYTTAPVPFWNSLMGPVMGFVGDTMYMQHKTGGIMPMFPPVAIDDPNLKNPGDSNQTAAEDIYDTLKAWYFLSEPTSNGTFTDSFTRNPGSYMGVGFNTYIQASTTPRELLVVADQLAQTSNVKIKDVMDPKLGETKDQAAVEMREFILNTLEEQVGQWFNVYTANLLEYNTLFNTIVGYPPGFLAVQHLNDHNLHYGYFLRAVAAIGRYDRQWLNTYAPLVQELLLDVAAFDNGASGYPQLRNFNPYYGHSWADGYASGGTNQESNSEAINFEIGMVELGEELNIPKYRDLGLYLYEEEILAAEQYYFNQDADLTDTTPDAKCPDKTPYTLIKSTPNICYNGNWPRNFVTYTSGVNNKIQHHTFVSRLQNKDIDRTTFFDDSPIAAYTIQWIPAAPALVYLGRDQDWLKATWAQFIQDDALYQGQANLKPSGLNVYQDLAAPVQAMLPTSGSGMTGTGLAAALARINNPHPPFYAAMNAEAKYLAYTMAKLGQLDGNTYVTRSPAGGAFKSGGTTTYVAVNLANSGNQVGFKGDASAGPYSLKPNTIQSIASGNVASFNPGTPPIPSNRLYFRKGGACTLANPCALTSFPGPNLLPASGTVAFPADATALAASMAIIPPRSDGLNTQYPAPPDGILSWVAKFKGSLVGAPEGSCSQLIPNGPTVCDPTQGLQTVDRFEIYANDCLVPGFQNCTPDQAIGNTFNMQVAYFFDISKCDPTNGYPARDPQKNPCNADRIELYTMTTGGVNTWTLQNKANEYFYAGYNLGYPTPPNKFGGFNGSFGLDVRVPDKNKVLQPIAAIPCTGQPNTAPRRPYTDTLHSSVQLPGTCTNTAAPNPPAGMFWQNVTNGAVAFYFWGGAFAAETKEPPTPISVNVSPLSNRASWFQPPYK